MERQQDRSVKGRLVPAGGLRAEDAAERLAALLGVPRSDALAALRLLAAEKWEIVVDPHDMDADEVVDLLEAVVGGPLAEGLYRVHAPTRLRVESEGSPEGGNA